jgi:DNA (cytosine-5)-methyltransferase 1
MTTIAERILSGEVEAPDLICGGTPCQAFSVAGLRNSLDDDRGNLTLQFIKICDANDAVRRASGREESWILYENVPGLLSTHDNAFGAFLGGLCGGNSAIVAPSGWGNSGVVHGPTRTVAYRILNAEHFGLAQRRKRVFVLAKGGAGRWAAADALLPIIESSRWHPAPSRSKGEVAAATTGQGAEGGCFRWQNDDAGIVADDVAASLRAKGTTTDERSVGSYVMAHGQANAEVVSDGSPSLTCNHEAPILVRMREGKEGGGKGPLVSEDQSLTLATANDQVLAYPINTQLGLRGAETSNSTREGVGIGNEGDPTFTLQSAHSHAVAVVPKDEVLATPFRDTADALTAAYGTKWNGNASADNGSLYAKSGMQVRRLTPVECERLQGFPDGYTDIPWRGKPNSPDGPRYKALGNSWAVPVVRYIGEQIKRVSR